MKIAIVGAGYVGLVTGACFADVGHRVICIDVDEAKIAGLREGIVPIYEPGLESIIANNINNGLIDFTTDYAAAVSDAEVVFIAVGTPPDEDGSADLQYVLAAAETLAEHMPTDCIVVDKSTVPVGTADKVKKRIATTMKKLRHERPFHVCSNPEFLKEGNAVEDFRRPARIIVGTDDEFVATKMRECYAPFNRNHDRLIVMDIRSAELTKYAANAMLATKISFINEVANIAEQVGADIEKVRQGIGSDPRIGYDFIYPGAGYGGSCFPKDVRALASTAGDLGLETHILDAVEQVNTAQKKRLFEKLMKALNNEIAGKRIAVWGLAFKPGTDDMREAPSRELINSVLEGRGTVTAFDPEAGQEARRIFDGREGFSVADDKNAAASGADALVICTEWNEFRATDLDWLKQNLKSPVVIDGRNLFDTAKAEAAGLVYVSIGR